MEKPVIVAVDDEPTVLSAVARDLRREYGEQYRILRADSGITALEMVRELKLRNAPVGLFLVDQRMPLMSGVEFLEEAIGIFPFAAGDVRQRSVKRVASAVGEGSMAVQFVHQYLSRVPE